MTSPASENDPTSAIAAALTFAASRAAHAAQDLDTVLDLTGVTDEVERQRAHDMSAPALSHFLPPMAR